MKNRLFSYCQPFKICAAVACLLFLPLAGFAAEDQEASTKVAMEQLNADPDYLAFFKLISSAELMTEEEEKSIDIEVNKILIYQESGGAKGSLPRAITRMIESHIRSYFIRNRRFKPIDCVECGITRVNLNKNNFSISKSIDTNESLKALASDIGANGALIWSASTDGNFISINMRIISTSDTSVVWSRQLVSQRYEEEVKEENRGRWNFHTGIMGASVTRLATDPAKSKKSLDNLFSIGVEKRWNTSNAKDVWFGVGFNLFRNIGETDYFGLTGFNLDARVISEIGDFFNMGKVSYYIGLGQSYFYSRHALTTKLGFEFNFNDFAFMDFGIYHLPSGTYEEDTLAGYSNDVELNGSSYELSFGIQF